LAPDVTLVLSWIVTCAIGAAMLLLAMRKNMLDRPRRRRCPSCGRFSDVHGCRCTKR
jgi:hypothetical protein